MLSPGCRRGVRIVNAVVASLDDQIHATIAWNDQISKVILQLPREVVDDFISGLRLESLSLRNALLLEKIWNTGQAAFIPTLAPCKRCSDGYQHACATSF